MQIRDFEAALNEKVKFEKLIWINRKNVNNLSDVRSTETAEMSSYLPLRMFINVSLIKNNIYIYYLKFFHQNISIRAT